MTKRRNNTTDKPFGSQMLGIIAILLGIFEGYLTLPWFAPWNIISTLNSDPWYGTVIVILFVLIALAQIGFGILLTSPLYKNKQKHKYEFILVLTIFSISLGCALGLVLIIMGLSTITLL